MNWLIRSSNFLVAFKTTTFFHVKNQSIILSQRVGSWVDDLVGKIRICLVTMKRLSNWGCLKQLRRVTVATSLQIIIW